MAGESRVGLIYVELDLDTSRFMKSQQTLLKDAKSTALNLEENFNKVGIKSDATFDLMRQKAANAYEKITTDARSSAADIIRAEQAKADRMKAIYNEQNAHVAKAQNELWGNMGIRSTAAIEAQKTSVMSSYATLAAAAKGNQQELINLERAKNDQLKKLNSEMVGEHEMSMASMTRAVLRFYAAYYVISAAVQAVSAAFQGGMKKVEDYNQSVASLAAMAVTFSEKGKGLTLEQSWEKALKYSTAMIPILEEIAAKTILSGTETTALANAFARSGVFLDGNNQKQIEAFTRISNALPLMTQGQEIMRQINTEIRSVMTGSNEASSMMLQTLKALPGFSMEMLQSWREQGTVLEHLGELLEGFGPATKILEVQWTAVKSTIETTADQVLRGAMKPIYEDIIGLVKDMDKWLKENKSTIQVGLVTAWELVKNTTIAVSAVLSGFSPIMKDIGKLTWEIAYGWGGIAAMSKPIGSAIGDSIEKMIIAAQMLVSYAKLGADVSLAIITGGLAGTDLAKSELANISELQIKYDKIGTASTLDAIDKELYAYQQRIDAYKDVEKSKTEALDASLMNRKNSLSSFHKEEEKLDAQARLNQSNNATIIKENELNALKDRLRGQQEYKDKVKGYGVEAAEAWVGADAARIQAEEKKADKLNNKDAINAAKEYTKAVEDTSEEYARLTMAEDDFKKNQIWKDWENRSDAATDAAKAVRDMQLAEVDLARQEELMKADEADKNKAIHALQEEENLLKKIEKSRERLLQLISPYSDEYEKMKNITLSYQAEIIQKEMDNANIAWDKEKWLTDMKNEELAKRLEGQAEYYGAIEGYENKSLELQKAAIAIRQKLNESLYGDAPAAAEKAAQDTAKAEYAAFRKKSDQVAESIGQMENAFTSIQGMYEKGSSEYSKWGEAAKAMIVAQKALAVVQAVVAIATQGSGDPYTAFARIAAMAAAMASLLGSIGASVGGGGGGSSAQSSGTAASQGANGRLGAEIGVGSESITNSMALLQETYDMESTKLTRIYNELRDLNDNITGLLTSIVRTGGINVSGSTGESLGSAQTLYNDIASYAFGGALVGDEIASLLTLGMSDLVSSVVGAVFGGESKTDVQWAGIAIGEALVSDLLKGIEVSAQQFISYHKETDGGMFGSSSNEFWTEYSALDQQVIDALTMVYQSMSDTLVYLAEGLGTDVQAVYDYVFKATSIDLKDMTTEQMNETLNEYFSTMMDTAVYDLFGEILLQYQKIDEALLETAIRLIRDKEVILSMLEMTGQGFEGAEEEAIALSEALIVLAGDLETLTDAASVYYENFTSDAQKQADLSNQLSEAMAEINMVMPDTRDGYAALVAALDLTTEAGQEAYVTLMMLAEGSDAYYTALEDALQTLESYSDYYDEFMGLNTELESTMNEIAEQYAAAYEAAVLRGESEEYLAQLYIASIEMQTKAMDDFAQATADAAAQAVKAAADLNKAFVAPLYDVGLAMYEWAQEIGGMTTEAIALSTLMIYRAYHGLTGTDIFDTGNMSDEEIKSYSVAVAQYAQTIVNMLESTYSALSAMKDTVANSIEGINLSSMTSAEQAAYYLNQATEAYLSLSTTATEDIPGVMQNAHDSLMKYYDLERQAIIDRHQTEIDAIKEKGEIELQNIEAVRNKLLELTYSQYNLALPTEIAADAQEDYNTLLAAAQTGDPDAVAKYLAFIDTYLQASQDKYKSSQEYLDIYDQVIRDIGALDTQPMATIEDLTDEQNRLIEEQTKMMEAELAELDKAMVTALESLGTVIDTSMTDIMTQMIEIFDAISVLINLAYPELNTEDNMMLENSDGYTAFEQWMTSIFWNGMIDWAGAELSILQKIAYNTAMISDALGSAGQYEYGGIASGPNTGYVATLHGTELVVSSKKSVPVKMSGSGGYDDSEIKNLLTTLVIQGSRNQNVTMVLDDGRTLKAVIRREADQLDQDRLEKGIKQRNWI